MSFHHFTMAAALMLGTAMLAGCGDQEGGDQQAKRAMPSSKSASHSKAHAHDHDCDHAEKGPHGGQVFELGGEYHAELVHDDKSGLIMIYLLDEQARNPVAIDEQQIVVNAMVEGKPATFELVAAPLQSDGERRSSRFQSNDHALIHSLEDHDSKSRLRASIDGKQFVAEIVPCEEHGHDDKDHTH